VRIDCCEHGNVRDVNQDALMDSQLVKHADGEKRMLIKLPVFKLSAKFITSYMYFLGFFCYYKRSHCVNMIQGSFGVRLN